ncbi:MAG: tetratricopeptide repeat protein [Acidobacteriota bacterium]
MSGPAEEVGAGRVNECITDLFCLCDDQARDGLLDALPQLLNRMNLSATCYLIEPAGPVDGSTSREVIRKVSEMLADQQFLQITARPVHVFGADTLRACREAYARLHAHCAPFQEEAYRHHIVARLRIFPILFVDDPASISDAARLATFLQQRFFLPSLLISSQFPIADQGVRPWERVYLMESSAFQPRSALDALYVNAIVDRWLESCGSNGPPCDGFTIIDSGGRIEHCVMEGRGDAQDACVDCVVKSWQTIERAIELNRRSDALDELQTHLLAGATSCERLAETIATLAARSDRFTVDRLSPPVLLQLGIAAYEKGDLEGSMRWLRAAREKDPEAAEIRYQMGRCEFAWRDYIEAADRFSEAVQLGLAGPMAADAQFHRGVCHYRIEEFDDALRALDDAASAGMEDSPLDFFSGLSWMGKGEPRRGLEYLISALDRGPAEEDLFHVLFYIAECHKSLGEFEQALEYSARALALDPRCKELHNCTGFCHFKRGEYDLAIACFERAIEIDPRSAIDWANMGSCMRDKGDRDGAVRMYRRALSIDPSIDFARDSLRRLEGRSG